MIRRFQIDDLIAQDETGVVFRAFDTESGKNVAVRRFFPFGATGGGLQADEQNAYIVAIGRLAELSHPALRSIICGGCDPVDGMPYIATEWIEGDSLESLLEHGPLPAQAATELINQALEVSELLSYVLAEDAVWIETDLHNIIVGNEQSGRGFTFWICPLKWLGSQEKNRSLQSIADLTEIVMGWQGHTLNDEAGNGLAGWLKWLRQAADTISLHEARETLAASVGVEPPPPTKKLITQATRPPTRVVPRPKKSSSKAAWIINVSLALVAAGLLFHQGSLQSLLSRFTRTHEVSPVAIPPSGPPGKAEPATPRAAEPNSPEPIAQPAPAIPADPQPAPPTPEETGSTDGVIPWDRSHFLIHHEGKVVTVEGVLELIDLSEQKTIMHLQFAKKPHKNDTRGVVDTKTAPNDLTESALAPLVGKKVRLRGTIQVHSVRGGIRAEILIQDRASIQPVE